MITKFHLQQYLKKLSINHQNKSLLVLSTCVVIVPSPSISNSENASLNSSTCCSLKSTSPIFLGPELSMICSVVMSLTNCMRTVQLCLVWYYGRMKHSKIPESINSQFLCFWTTLLIWQGLYLVELWNYNFMLIILPFCDSIQVGILFNINHNIKNTNEA